MLKIKKIIFVIAIIIISIACSNNSSTPKPHAYFRIKLPKHEYKMLGNNYPYKFEYPTYSKISKDTLKNAEKYWININYPEFKGTIHLSYKEINDNFNALFEDTRRMVYKHAVKADAIEEKLIKFPQNKTYGILYKIGGDVASSVQFFITDSTKNYLRGSLYFNVVPNEDSIAPVIKFVTDDIVHLIETAKWNN